jgi:hypothetical protein
MALAWAKVIATVRPLEVRRKFPAPRPSGRFRSQSDQTSNSGSSGPIIPSLDVTSLRGSPPHAAEFPNDGEGGVAEGDERLYLGDVVGLGVLGGQLSGYGCPRRAAG